MAFVFPARAISGPAWVATPTPRCRTTGQPPRSAGPRSPPPICPPRALPHRPRRTAFAEIEIEGAQFIHHVALASVWRACKCCRTLTIGHSLGEVAAAHVAGALSLADAVRIVATRASVVDRLTGDHAVAALGIGAAAAQELVEATPGWLELSVVNAENAVAVSGERAAVRALVEAVRSRGGLAREITVNFPVHTSVLEPLRDELHRSGRRVDSPTPQCNSSAVRREPW